MKKDLNGITFDDVTAYFFETRNKFIRSGCIWFECLYVNAFIVRAYQLNKGFQAMVDAGNYICAAPLVRIQLETLFRLYGGYIYRNESYYQNLVNGKSLDSLKYKGKKLTYGYLAELLGKFLKENRLYQIYKNGNSFVHPSDKAFKAATSSEGRKITIQNLEGQLYEEADMEEIYMNMLYINICYASVLEAYLKLFYENVFAASQQPEGKPITDQETLLEVKNKINNLFNATRRK